MFLETGGYDMVILFIFFFSSMSRAIVNLKHGKIMGCFYLVPLTFDSCVCFCFKFHDFGRWRANVFSDYVNKVIILIFSDPGH